MRTRAAASSIASGMPSRRSTICSIAFDASASGVNPGRACCARSTNSATDVERSSDGTRHATSPATPSGSRLVASTRKRGHARKQRLDHLGRRVEHLLAVVDDQQRVEIVQLFGQRVDERTPELLAQAEHTGDRLGDVAAVRDRGELRAPHAVGVTVELVRRRVQREPGLATAAGTGQRHQPVLAHGLAHRGDLSVTADEARHLRGQVRRHRAERAQRRELVAEVGMHELPDPLGPPKILQPMQVQDHGARRLRAARRPPDRVSRRR